MAGEPALGAAIKEAKEHLRALPNDLTYGVLRYLNSEVDLDGVDLPIGFNYLGRLGAVGPELSDELWRVSKEALSFTAATTALALPLAHSLELNAGTVDADAGPHLRADWTWAPSALNHAQVTRLTQLWFDALAGVCALLGVIAAGRLLPTGTTRLQRGRPAAVATLGVVTGAYFGASAVVTILAHDLLGFSVPQLGFLLLAGGLGWSVTGVFVGRSPAVGVRYISRARWGASLLTAGLVTMWIAVAAHLASTTTYIAAWTVAGVGMGLVYLDTINVIVEEPPAPDGISPVAAGTSTVVVEQASAALIGTAVATAVGALLSSTASSAAVASSLLLLALITSGLWLTTARTKTA